ncbi:MAG: Na(+)/H(+) antiporter subunit F1 [Pelotomaculaceae bacterium]|jgi:multicomponent Na+:H+ antiporter subunit F|nr:Na(+)/H(+) antiporter subunit F1 [Bacillota bacterium]HHU85881.1 Na(+)/H(+) antiporter subunit F1 [Peptococcaceae bacterium]
MLKVLLMTSLFLFAVSIAIFLYRFVKGPSIPDRIIAMDAIGISLIAMMAILSILLKTYAFFDVILLFGILSFVGTVAFSKFIERGVVVDYERDR